MNKIKKLKAIPKFKNEVEERQFWKRHDTTEYFNTKKPVKLDLSNLKPSTKSVCLRLSEMLLADLKRLANKKDVPYQSLMKIMLSEATRREFA